jgi:hypothetical protein
LDYWIGLDILVQSNPIIQKKSNQNPNIQLFWIFGVEYGWMYNHPFNPKKS